MQCNQISYDLEEQYLANMLSQQPQVALLVKIPFTTFVETREKGNRNCEYDCNVAIIFIPAFKYFTKMSFCRQKSGVRNAQKFRSYVMYVARPLCESNVGHCTQRTCVNLLQTNCLFKKVDKNWHMHKTITLLTGVERF